MTDYIKRIDALNASKIVYIEYIAVDDEGYEDGDADDIPCVFKKDIEKIPAADVREVVYCRDCKYWKDKHVKQNDGRERQYLESDKDGLLQGYVTSDVGINVGAKCCYEDGEGWAIDNPIFRNGDDFCSRGKKRPTTYEKWWGIVRGFYPAPSEEE